VEQIQEKSVRVVVRGRVQGVGYRAWLARHALHLRLKGWVRNRSDGTVEAVLLGPAPAVDMMLGLCGKGPRFCEVEAVEASPVVNEGWPDFSVRPTA
jgi:acylphosphatase